MKEVTLDNISERLKDRELKDLLNNARHPNEYKDGQGYTYLDYALWVMTQPKRKMNIPVKDINYIIKHGDISHYYN